MYKLQLIRKYLFKRRIAWVALVAVMLCTAMVLVVVSVMGGWLRAFEDSFHGMTGDVVITSDSMAGFPEYEEMIDSIKKLPDAQAAVPVVTTWGLVNIRDVEMQTVKVLGYPSNIDEVNAWKSSLHLNVDDRRKELETALAQPGLTDADKAHLQNDLRVLPFGLHPDIPYPGVAGKRAADPRDRPGMVISSALVGMRHDKPAEADALRDVLYTAPVTLTVMPIRGGESPDPKDITAAGFWIVDDAKSRIWQFDNNNVYISLEEAQKLLGMDGLHGEHKRCSELLIKAKPGVDLTKLRDEVAVVTDKIRVDREIPIYYGFHVQTWVEQQGTFIQAVKKEVVLTTGLFGFISFVAVLLIFCIFYMIVVEKTKDIGILKSIGATGWGILNLFLGYGLAIGVVGASAGFAVAFVLVKNINEIHAWLGRRMGVVIFSPETYQLEKIPDRMEPQTVVYVLLIAVASALLGALIPAMRAASMNPVDALRYE